MVGSGACKIARVCGQGCNAARYWSADTDRVLRSRETYDHGFQPESRYTVMVNVRARKTRVRKTFPQETVVISDEMRLTLVQCSAPSPVDNDEAPRKWGKLNGDELSAHRDSSAPGGSKGLLHIHHIPSLPLSSPLSFHVRLRPSSGNVLKVRSRVGDAALALGCLITWR